MNLYPLSLHVIVVSVLQKALQECETEWSQNKKVVDISQKDIRHAVSSYAKTRLALRSSILKVNRFLIKGGQLLHVGYLLDWIGDGKYK